MRDAAVRPLDALVALSVGGLCLLVVAVGALGLLAEFVGTWRSLFLFEQTLTTVAPATVAAVVGVLVVGAVVVATAE